MMMLVRGFELGLHLTVIAPVSRPLARFAPAEHFDFTAMVPLQLHATLHGHAHERAILDGMKAVLIGGAPVSLALEEQLQRVQAPLYHTYGMTETVSHIALRRLNGPQRSDRFVPFADVRLDVDARGCLTITSALTLGKTLSTNDLVEFHTDGSLRWLGRIDNVINSGGVKIHIEQVERALEAYLLHYQGGVYAERRFCVGPFPHLRLGQVVVALIEGEPCGSDATTASAFTTALRTALQPALTPYEIPRQVFFVPQFLETRTGKIDRSANLQRLVAQHPAPQPTP
jgi:O-succinylbenzoic acid--CoA ligase